MLEPQGVGAAMTKAGWTKLESIPGRVGDEERQLSGSNKGQHLSTNPVASHIEHAVASGSALGVASVLHGVVLQSLRRVLIARSHVEGVRSAFFLLF